MKILWGAIIVAALVVGVSVAGELYTRSTEKVVTFAQLPASFQEIPVYPNAQSFWRGTAQEERVNRILITTFTTSDPTDKVMDFYRSTLESTGWSYDTSGHLSVDCHSFYDGDFYVNSQGDHVWVAALHKGGTGIEYQIFKVGGSFWMYGDCF